ncbi:A24 family peptidase [Streptomyces sp. NBC_01387]|uniref:prepilin peptidase n=1 Tax=unclassified Streptomyces TaxID=2593676 RepID=UPI002024D06F|nr:MULTISPECIES: A24 family peptidase [unclassified Streptomyces]MCX4548527.1 A24 family peptidase [Streptomyces sp. NBC_01500]WSC20140.1 A24 family peptidase [Streptomyces sp. NBC_01766]WSV54158.1 A24 family peptidase [Streptomyces sp. NBC_01014]
MSAVLIVVIAACFGAAAGVLLPRPAYRLAVEPGTPWQDTTPSGQPIAGWLGPARAGDGWYGPGTPVTATVTALCCAALAAAAGPVPELAVWVLLAPALVLLGMVDRAVQRLPDVLTLPILAATAALLGAAALVPGAKGSWTAALLGGLALGGGYFVLFVINPNGMGFGDVKLAAGLGVALGWYGWGVLLLGAFAGFLYGALYGAALMVRGRAGRKTSMPFGPFMVAGAFTGLLLGGFGAS